MSGRAALRGRTFWFVDAGRGLPQKIETALPRSSVESKAKEFRAGIVACFGIASPRVSSGLPAKLASMSKRFITL
jgi:hypothetical protein